MGHAREIWNLAAESNDGANPLRFQRRESSGPHTAASRESRLGTPLALRHYRRSLDHGTVAAAIRKAGYAVDRLAYAS